MLTLERPTRTARATFDFCISRVRSVVLRTRLEAASATIAQASIAYGAAARRHALHEIAESDIVAPDITTAEMEAVYTGRMAKAGSPGRDIYDEIYSSAPQNRCPLCVQRQVATLDHHLPKAHYPAFAVVPLNLVPCCSDCNKAKLNACPGTAEEVALHPYYDNLGEDVWLVARVIETAPAALRFSVVAPVAWTETLTRRVRNHFRTLGLASLYGSEAADELVNIRHGLRLTRASGGLEAVRDELGRTAISTAQGRPNGWRAASYHAWSQSDWFCDGGFS